jgi:hypothetical protein
MVPCKDNHLYQFHPLTAKQERNQQYVVMVEVYLAKAFSSDPAEEGEEPPYVVIQVSHFSIFTNYLWKCF